MGNRLVFRKPAQWQRRLRLPHALNGMVVMGLVLAAALSGGFVPGSVAQAQGSPSITVTPDSGPPGSTRVTVRGSGFEEDGEVIIEFDQARVGDAEVNADGSFRDDFTVPNAPRGSVQIKATSTYTHEIRPATDTAPAETERRTETATDTFQVESAANLDVKEGQVGATFSISGQGFGNREDLEVRFGAEDLNCEGRISSNGALRATCRVPPLVADAYTVEVNELVVGTFTIASTFAITPTSGPPGTVVNLRGTGFTPSGRVQVAIDTNPLPAAFIDRDGKLSSQIQIPPISGGPKVISASASGEAGGHATFQVTPTLSVSPTSVSPGDVVRVSGTAFRANEREIAVRFNSATVSGGIVADPRGLWETTFEVPSTTAGNHIVSSFGSLTTTNLPSVRVTVGTSVKLSRAVGSPGASVTVSGSGAVADERISIDVGNGLFRTAVQAGQNGVWSAEIIIPPAPRGEMEIEISGGSGTRSTSQTFNVVPAISSSTSKGTPGSTVTLSGIGFGASQSGITIDVGDESVDSANADPTGSWTHQITMPAYPSGTVYIQVPGVDSDLRLPFTVVPIVSVDRSNARPGESVTVTGSGFRANEPGITIKMGQTTVAQGITAHDNGSWTATFVVPRLPGQSYSIGVSGFRTSPGAVAEPSLELTRYIALEPEDGAPGSTIVVSGHGFTASESDITIIYSGQVVASGVESDSSGNFVKSFVVPTSPRGRHTVTTTSVIPNAGENPVANFRISSALALSNGGGVPGTEVTVTGVGFGALESGITVGFSGNVILNDVTADANGVIGASFQVPPAPGGEHFITVSGVDRGSGGQFQQPYTVLPRIALSGTGGHVGSSLTISGDGFGAGSSLTVDYDGEQLMPSVTDSLGSFALTVEIPQSVGGQHTIRVFDGLGNTLAQKFEVEAVPPLAPVLESPSDGTRGGFFGGFRPTSRWAPVEDPSGVSYNIEMSTDPEFSSIYLEATGLTDPTYAISEELALPRGNYYWRVQAVDNASNIGPYSQVFEVNSGRIAAWLFWLLLGLLVAAAAGAAVFWYLRAQQRRAAVPVSPAFPEFVRISRPELAAPGQPAPGGPAQVPPPARRALPSPFRRGGGQASVTPEQRAQMQLVTDFVQSIPLIEMSPDLLWMEELVENLGGDPASAYAQLLNGVLEVEYTPLWMQHPTFFDMQDLPAAAPFMAGLEEYVAAVNDCAFGMMALLRRIDDDLDNAAPPEVSPDLRWRYILSIAQANTAWFRGTLLAQPSPREYLVQPGSGAEDGTLYGADNSPFAGPIMRGLSVIDLEYYRDLHIQLRNDYRTDESARALVSRITATRSLGVQLQNNIASMGEQVQG